MDTLSDTLTKNSVQFERKGVFRSCLIPVMELFCGNSLPLKAGKYINISAENFIKDRKMILGNNNNPILILIS